MFKREFIKKTVVAGAGLLWTPGVFAEMLQQTPPQMEGPFYPDKMPLDTDNDLLIVGDSINPAVGTISHLHGKVTDVKGIPLSNALVEIWQVDGKGAYLHGRDPRSKNRDTNFQGYGRFSTNRKGEYYFRTVRPVSYPGRVPHIHVKVSHKGRHLLTTQIYINGLKGNDNDFLFKRVGKAKDLLCADFVPIKESKIGELSAKFDIIVGLTPND